MAGANVAGTSERPDDAEDASSYALVGNIPGEMRSADLRHFFSEFVEASKFTCFHFRHRPEVKLATDDCPNLTEGTIKKPGKTETTCCLVKMTPKHRAELAIKYHMKRWKPLESSVCVIRAVKLQDCSASSSVDQELSKNAGPVLKQSEVNSMLELNPPAFIMPQGNVGTPTKHFLTLIQQCKLPAKVIKNLRLEFPKCSGKRIYSNVEFKYDEKYRDMSPEERVRAIHCPADPDDQGEADDDKDECEEWERHEALHDDVTQHERTKPKLFEEEMEVVWEKGGPGLVFYTDDFYWSQQKGTDTDELWADDWDVDMEAFYSNNPQAGDKDARDHNVIRKEQAGKWADSVFRKTKQQVGRKRRARSESPTAGCCERKTGAFEAHTKGFGRKVMESMGWRDGSGLGSSSGGRINPVSDDIESRKPFDKKGLGYLGEKLQRTGFTKMAKHTIRTKYDDPVLFDPLPHILRRSEPTWDKHRK